MSFKGQLTFNAKWTRLKSFRSNMNTKASTCLIFFSRWCLIVSNPFLKRVTCFCRYLLCPGHLSVPATGRWLIKCMPDGAAHENTEGLQHSNPGPVLLLLQCHFGACPKAGSAPSQSVSFSPDFPNQSMSPDISAVNLLTPSRVV